MNQKNNGMNDLIRGVLRVGLLVGLVVVYVSVIGMVETFDEREVIRDWVTMGQLLIFMPGIVGGFLLTRRRRNQGSNLSLTLLGGLAVGIVSSLPVLLLIFLATVLDVGEIFVNVNRNLLEILTFDNDSRVLGGLTMAGFITLAGVVGMLLMLIPQRFRQGVLTAVGVTLGVGILGELVTLVFRQFVPRDFIEIFFRRDELKLNGALTVFGISLALSLLWSFYGATIRENYRSMPSRQQRNVERGGFTALGIFLLVLPWILGAFLSNVTNSIGLYILMGLGLNIAIGLAGLLDLGYVTNFAVGAYVMGVLTSTGPLGVQEQLGIEFLNFWLVLPIAVLCAMFTGFIFAVPVLRMRGDYLAIATLGFGEIIGKLAVSDALSPVIGGAQGVLFIPSPMISIPFTDVTLEFQEPQMLYYVILGACALALFVSIRLNNSRTGRQWMSIREDEDVAAAMGIDTARSKLLAFTLSAATGGLAGAIFAAQVDSVFPNSFRVLVSINVLSLIIVGGMGSVPGIVLGAVVLIGMPELLREFSEYRLLLYGVLLVFMMTSRPEGLIPSRVHRRELKQTNPPDAADDTDSPTLNPA
jgi:branched-chain amino acid transport system permease protein